MSILSPAERAPAIDYAEIPSLIERTLVGLLAGSCLLIPLLFSIAVEDSFALPKTSAARGITLAGFALLAAAPVLLTRVKLHLVDIAVVVFVVLNVLAYAHSVDRDQSLNGERLQYQGVLTTLMYVGAFYLARTSITTNAGVRTLCLAIVFGTTCTATYGLFQKAGYDPIWSGVPNGRVFSTIGQPNALAAYLVMAILIGVSLLNTLTPKRQLALGTALAMMVTSLLFTFSRGGYLALLLSIPLVLLATNKTLWPRLRTMVVSGLLLSTAVVLMFAVSPAARGEVSYAWQRVTNATGDESAELHLSLWRIGVAVANDNPALGTGQETFPLMVPAYRDATLSTDQSRVVSKYRPESPHNVYIATAAGSGYPALLVYLLLIAGTCATALAQLKRKGSGAEWSFVRIGMLAAITAHLVTDFFMTAEITSSWLFWLLLGALLSSSVESRQVASVERRRDRRNLT